MGQEFPKKIVIFLLSARAAVRRMSGRIDLTGSYGHVQPGSGMPAIHQSSTDIPNLMNERSRVGGGQGLRVKGEFCQAIAQWDSLVYDPKNHGIICPRSSDPFYIVSYYINLVTSSWTHSTRNGCPEWYREFYLLNVFFRSTAVENFTLVL